MYRKVLTQGAKFGSGATGWTTLLYVYGVHYEYTTVKYCTVHKESIIWMCLGPIVPRARS